jgi:capsid protein
MGLFDRNKKPSKSDLRQQQLNIQESNLRMKEKAVKTMMKMADGIQAKMQSFHSFPEELYTTGIKQGTNAGLRVGNNKIARRLSRITMNESPVAQSIVNTFNTLTVGHGLEPEAQPIWDLIPQAPTDEEIRTTWMKNTESRYMLWAKRKSISYDETMSRFEQEQYIFERLLIDGEYFEVYRYSANTKRNPMTIQEIRPEDVRTPSGSVVAKNNTEEDGIEYDSRGAAIAYHIYDHITQKTVRVLKKGTRSGRVFVNHVKLGGNRRGVGIIANMITELMKLGDYEVLELQAAVVNALYAVWMETPAGEDGVPTLSPGIGSSAQQTTETINFEDWQRDRKDLNYTEGGIVIDNLPGGYKMNSHDTKRPNVNFGAFTDQVKKNLAASRNLPISVLDKQFQNNYSASRGELILAWYEIEKMRFNQSMTNALVYKMWMWGEVIAERITAPGFTDSEDIMDAWTNAKWIGNQRPDIDPLRSVKAHIEEQKMAYRTGKQITAERGGGDYDENLIRVGKEIKKVADNIEPLSAMGQSETTLTDGA